jgi:hypothetical protein
MKRNRVTGHPAHILDGFVIGFREKCHGVKVENMARCLHPFSSVNGAFVKPREKSSFLYVY